MNTVTKHIKRTIVYHSTGCVIVVVIVGGGCAVDAAAAASNDETVDLISVQNPYVMFH